MDKSEYNYRVRLPLSQATSQPAQHWGLLGHSGFFFVRWLHFCSRDMLSPHWEADWAVTLKCLQQVELQSQGQSHGNKTK